MAVSISVPLAVVDENYVQPFMEEELDLSAFTPAAKTMLFRVYAGLRVAGFEGAPATLADGAEVNSTARVFQWLVEAVAAAE